MRDVMTEAFFLNAYGSRLLQAQVGLAAAEETPRRTERDLVREAAAAERRSKLDQKFEEGGLEEAALRALLYVRLPDSAFDERSFRMLKAIREQRKSNDRIPPSQFRDMLNVQLQLVRLDEERAVQTIHTLRATNSTSVRRGARCSRSSRRGALNREGQRRWARVEKLFGGEFQGNPKPKGRKCLTLTLKQRPSRTTNMTVS